MSEKARAALEYLIEWYDRMAGEAYDMGDDDRAHRYEEASVLYSKELKALEGGS